MYIICTQRYTEFGESKMAANSKITVNKKNYCTYFYVHIIQMSVMCVNK